MTNSQQSRQYNERNHFVLFQNHKRKSELSPTHTGKGDIEGCKITLAGWRQEDKSIQLKARAVEQNGPSGGGTIAPTGQNNEKGLPIFFGKLEFDGNSYTITCSVQISKANEKYLPGRFHSTSETPEASEPPAEEQQESRGTTP